MVPVIHIIMHSSSENTKQFLYFALLSYSLEEVDLDSWSTLVICLTYNSYNNHMKIKLLNIKETFELNIKLSKRIAI